MQIVNFLVESFKNKEINSFAGQTLRIFIKSELYTDLLNINVLKDISETAKQ